MTKIFPTLVLYNYILRIFPFLFFSFVCSCKKNLTVSLPNDQLSSDLVFTTAATAKSAVDAIYSGMCSSEGFASGSYSSVSSLAGLSADELNTATTNDDMAQFYRNALASANIHNEASLWGQSYNAIYMANAAVNGLSASTNLDAGLRDQLLGEVKFARAFCFFYLVNLYGDVPLLLTTDYTKNAVASRTPVSEVYQQIVADLTDAKQLLQEEYALSLGERIRPNRSAASAMLARVYLYLEQWQSAESEAGEAINHTDLYGLEDDLDHVFLKSSREAIWQLMPVFSGLNTLDGFNFVLTDAPSSDTYNSSFLNAHLLDAFESGDKRRLYWVGQFDTDAGSYFYPNKYKIKFGDDITEYSMVLRLAEQYLIRAEARAHMNKIEEAQADLNIVRNRSGLTNTSANEEQALLTAIAAERYVELFTEWGHRWLDLKRTKTAHAVLSLIKGNGWSATDVLYPIPESEIQKNSHLTQNTY